MNKRLLIHLIIYVTLVLLGLLIAIPVAITQNKMGGYCILHGKAVYQEQGLETKFIMDKKNAKHHCVFTIYFNTATILYAFALSFAYGFLFHRSRKLRPIHLPEWTKILNFVIDTLVFFITLISGFLLIAGFSAWCSHVVGNPPNSCAEGQKMIKWDKKKSDGSTFYTNYVMAIVCCWISICAWGISVGLEAPPYWRRIREYLKTKKSTEPTQPPNEPSPSPKKKSDKKNRKNSLVLPPPTAPTSPASEPAKTLKSDASDLPSNNPFNER